MKRKALHKPTKEQRAQVEALSGFGIPHAEIGRYMGIDPKTLRKHYRDQIDNGMTRANVAVLTSLHAQAVNGNITAAIFWAKTRCGFREKSEVEHSGEIGLRTFKLVVEPGSE